MTIIETAESLAADAPEIFKVLPEAVFAGKKLFIAETRRVATIALKVCRTCKDQVRMSMLKNPGVGNSYAFTVQCSRCNKETDGFPVTKENENSKLAMMRSMAATVDNWNNINTR